MAAAAQLSSYVPWLSQLRLQQTIAQFRTPLVAQVRTRATLGRSGGVIGLSLVVQCVMRRWSEDSLRETL
jgi:hypothetical protein